MENGYLPPSFKPQGKTSQILVCSCSELESSALFTMSFQVICQLKGGAQMLCIDNCGARELKALHLLPQYDDQNSFPQSGTMVQRLLWATHTGGGEEWDSRGAC